MNPGSEMARQRNPKNCTMRQDSNGQNAKDEATTVCRMPDKHVVKSLMPGYQERQKVNSDQDNTNGEWTEDILIWCNKDIKLSLIHISEPTRPY